MDYLMGKCVDCFADWLFPVFFFFFPSSWASLFLKTTVLKLGQLITLQRLLSVQVKGRVTFTFKLKARNKLGKESMLKAKTAPQLGLSCQTVSQVVNPKEKFLKEIKSESLIHVKRKRNYFVADADKA